MNILTSVQDAITTLALWKIIIFLMILAIVIAIIIAIKKALINYAIKEMALEIRKNNSALAKAIANECKKLMDQEQAEAGSKPTEPIA